MSLQGRAARFEGRPEQIDVEPAIGDILSSVLRSFGTAAALLLLLVGAGALGYARWSRLIVEGDAALAAGQFDRAIASYASAEARFDETIEKAEASPEEAAPHFWSGCAFFEKARAEEQPDAILGWLTRAGGCCYIASRGHPAGG